MTKRDERRFRGRCVTCNDIAYLSEADAIANKGQYFPPEIGKLVFKACPRQCGLWIVDHIERPAQATVDDDKRRAAS